VVMGDLASARLQALTAPMKLRRNVRSYAVEAGLLGSRAAVQLTNAGVRVPRAYAVDLQPCDEDPIESRFALLLSDFAPEDGWYQKGLLGDGDSRAALSTLARFHGFFWSRSDFWRSGKAACAELEATVWPAGGYWQPSMQPASQLDELSLKWETHLHQHLPTSFSDLPELRGIDLATLGGRLQTVAKEVAAGAHPFDVSSGGDASANARFKTLIHGDPKAANLFIRDGSGSTEVGLIDFQWSGWGLAATDVAHHICAAVAPDALVDADSLDQSSLLSHYHTELCHALTDFGVVSSAEEADATLLSRELLQAQYEVALLDMCRLVFGYQWSRFKLSDTPESLNRNSYNKDLRNAAWLVQKCDELLTKRESV